MIVTLVQQLIRILREKELFPKFDSLLNQQQCDVELPPEIIEVILMKVPIEMLGELKTVCKLWYILISDHYVLRNNHAQRLLCKSQPDITLRIEKLLPQNRHSVTSIQYFSITLEPYKGIRAAEFEVNVSYQNLHNRLIRIIASCNGLLLLENELSTSRKWIRGQWLQGELYICNPYTRQCITLPSINHDMKAYSWVLVYDASIKKYKVIGMPFAGGYPGSYKCFILTVELYGDSMGWREIDPLGYLTNIQQFVPVFAHGELHWVLKDMLLLRTHIASLDIASEKLRMINPTLSTNGGIISISELDGNLYLVDTHLTKNQIDIWSLKDSVQKVWNKDYSISLASLPPSKGVDCFWCVQLTACEKRDPKCDKIQILLIFSNNVFHYDSGRHKWRLILTRDPSHFKFCMISNL